jgi:iron complex outermembrane recepter protein
MYKKRLLPLCIALSITGQLQAQEEQPEAEEVIVTGVRNAELNAREVERSKNIFSSVISQDDAGNFADQNVAESLQRLPGITLQKSEGEGKFVSVRGLGPGFVTVQQNGAELASAGSDDRSFALDAIPSDLLGAIEVFKSLTPDMDLNSIGGVVNVKTVSAFDRKKDSLRLNVQDYYQDYSEEHSPKVSIQGTNLFADDTIGLGYSASWEERKTVNYEMLHHETTDPRYVQQDLLTTTPNVEDIRYGYMLIPFEFQNRQEVAERERSALSLDLGYRPTENSEYYARGSYTEYTDMDIAWREYYRFGQAGADDIVYISPDTSTFGVVDADIQQQMFIQDGTSKTTSYSLGGKNNLNVSDGQYQLEYEYSWSESTYSKPDGQRVQFRERDVPLIARFDQEYIVAQAISPNDLAALNGMTVTQAGFIPDQVGGYTNQGISLGGFEFDNLFLENSSRLDELSGVQLNLKREFSDGWLNYWKTGFSLKERIRERNQDRWSLVPKDFSPECADAPDVLQCRRDIQSNLSSHENELVDHPNFVYPSITKPGAEKLIASVRAIANQDTQQGLESIYRDYTLTEDTVAAYLMGEFQLSENQSLITGVRWEETEFSSTGYFAVNNDNFDVGAGNSVSFDYSIPMNAEGSKYDDFYPSIHYRFEPREDVLIRSSIWTSFTRPSFDQARGFANIESDFQLCNPVSGVCSATPDAPNLTAEDLKSYTLGPNSALNLGNPGLVAMNSLNLDASVGWYVDKSQFFQAALFYKDIDDFIISVQGSQIALNDLPVRLPVSQVDGFIIPEDLVMNNVNWTTNGDKAKVYGIELTYVYNFDSGFFFQTNTTFMNSSAHAGDSIRVGKIQLPEQADTTANVTVGWENEVYSARLIGNYNSEILKRIGSCPAGSEGRLISTPSNPGTTCKEWADQYLDATFSMDFKATYQITDELKVYFDAMNITDEYMTKYFQGNEYSGGKIMYHSEVYGRSFQMGLNYKFM